MLESVFSQSFQDWELIIMNDGSTDRTWEIVTRLAGNHPQVRLLENPQNIGQCETLNRLLPEARGTWVGVLPADDQYRAHTLRTIHDYVRDREDLNLWTHSRVSAGDGAVPDVILIRNALTEWSADTLADELFTRGNVFGGMANYLFRRTAILEPKLTFAGDDSIVDLSFWIRLLKAHPEARAVYHPDVLSYVAKHAASLSTTCGLSGASSIGVFDLPRQLLYLNWSRPVRLYQIARLIKCAFTLGPDLPPGNRWLPLWSILALVKSLPRPHKE